MFVVGGRRSIQVLPVISFSRVRQKPLRGIDRLIVLRAIAAVRFPVNPHRRRAQRREPTFESNIKYLTSNPPTDGFAVANVSAPTRNTLLFRFLSARSALPSLLIEKVSASLDSVHWVGFQTRIPAVRANSWNDER